MSHVGRSEAALDTAMASLGTVLRTQSDKTRDALSRLEVCNRAATDRYVALNSAAEGLSADGTFLRANNEEIARYVRQVDDVSLEIERLEKLVGQMDAWSKELAVKARRM